MEAAAKPAPSAPRRRGIVTVLLVVATVLAFVGSFSVWANRQALNTDNWVNTSTKLLGNEGAKAEVLGRTSAPGA